MLSRCPSASSPRRHLSVFFFYLPCIWLEEVVLAPFKGLEEGAFKSPPSHNLSEYNFARFSHLMSTSFRQPRAYCGVELSTLSDHFPERVFRTSDALLIAFGALDSDDFSPISSSHSRLASLASPPVRTAPNFVSVRGIPSTFRLRISLFQLPSVPVL